MPDPVRFRDGASYDAMMGGWSRSVGEIFLDWMAPSAGLAWIDVGCGSGAFSALVAERCAPASIVGIDPSEAQLEFARTRPLQHIARFEQGDAMALPLPDASVDIAAAALVVHFMPDPKRGVAEMARVVKPGGIVAGYAWDLANGGFPYDALHVAMRALGVPVSEPPSPQAAEMPELKRLWSAASIDIGATREIVVRRKFAAFEDYWSMATTAPRIAMSLDKAPPGVVDELKQRVRAAFTPEPNGVIVPAARANAIWGRVAK
jgi:ubiquinone/menaquinone biosynthesis C-methylase UbiE